MPVSRRRLLVLGASLAGVAFACLAQRSGGKPVRLGFLAGLSLASYRGRSNWDALLAGLREHGYIEGKTMTLEVRSADGDYARLPQVAADLVRERPDLIMAVGTPASQAAKQATATIPIVMLGAADPVRSGLVASLARPGGNLTGPSNLSPDLMKKRVEFLVEAKPGLRRIGVLLNSSNPAQPLSFEAIQSIADALKIEPLRFDVRYGEEIRAAFAAMQKQRVEALVVGNDVLLASHAKEIADLAIDRGLLIAGDREFVEAGGLIGYGSTAEVWRHAATYVDKILGGVKPSELPIEQPRNIELVVNLKTSKALGLTLPAAFRSRVDKVIQ